MMRLLLKPLAKTDVVRACAPVLVPVTVVSELNQREHHMAKYRRKVQQQSVTLLTLNAAVPPARARALNPRGVWLTRVIATRGKKMDDGNLGASFKHVQDAVAKWLGIDDGKLQWSYAQERGHVAGVRVEVWSAAP